MDWAPKGLKGLDSAAYHRGEDACWMSALSLLIHQTTDTKNFVTKWPGPVMSWPYCKPDCSAKDELPSTVKAFVTEL